MKPVITPTESGRLDAEAHVPVETLMDRAGLGVALAAADMGMSYGSRVTVLAGPGNNGGDGYVAARYLARRGVTVVVQALGYPRGDYSPARKAAVAAADAGVAVSPMGPPHQADLVIDALFGAGFRGELPEPAAQWAEAGLPVLAVDVPSGLDAATGEVAGACFTAQRTVTFHAPKVGHFIGLGPDRCGRLDVVDIGLTEGRADDTVAELKLCEETDAPRPIRPRTAHKWSSGSVLVVGGSPGLTGAPLLAAQAALGFGAGAAAVACPGGLQHVYESMAPGVMTVAVGDGSRFDAFDAPELLDRATRYGVLALGPGLGPGQEEFVSAVIENRSGPVVIDADGLNALASPRQLAARDGETILTPHHGEFRRFAGVEPSYRAALEYAAKSRATVILKGNPTIVAGGEAWVVDSGGPELATIGTGDVLTGIVAAVWGRGVAAETAARSGAYWHGVAGSALAARRTVTAEGLAAEVGRWAWKA